MLIIGASKCSTTTLYRLLQRHPDVWLPRDKGAYYFTSPDYDKPERWQDYLKLFEDAPKSKAIVGESSNTYTQRPDRRLVPIRIRERLGHPKLIYLVRDPVDRAVSHFRHKYLTGGSKYATSFAQALESDPLLVMVSCYATQLRPFHEEFGTGSVLILAAEQLHKAPFGVMREIERYLEISPFNWQQNHWPRSNSYAELRQTVGWQKLVGERAFRRIRRRVPGFARRLLKPLAPRIWEPPPVTEMDKEKILELVSDDLRQLTGLLGDRIADWPSVQRLSSY